MSMMSAVLIISLAAAIILVVGGGLLMYMTNLIKNAHEIKVQINADLDERLKLITDDLDKKSTWMRRDVNEEFDKFRNAQALEGNRRAQELLDPLNRRLDALESVMMSDRAAITQSTESVKSGTAALDTKIAQLRRDLRRVEDKLGIDPSVPGPSTAAPPKPEGAQPAAPTAPTPDATPRKVASILTELG